MNFEFSEDQRLVQKTARDFLTEQGGLALCRGVLESERPYDADLWKGVAEMGWLGAAVPEAFGGAGLGHLELVLLAEEVGRALAPIPFSSSVYLATEALLLAGTEAQKQRHLPRLAAGECIGTFALFEGPGEIDAASVATRLAGDRVSGTKLPVPDGDVAGLAVVLARGPGDGHSLVLVDLEAEGTTRTALDSFDPSRSQAKLVFEGARAEVLGEPNRGWELAERILDRAAVLMAFEQIGGAERALEDTRTYAMGRYTFGRPVASFQAIKHRLADLYCAVELARSNAYYGAWALSSNSPELALAAPGARISATEAFDLGAREMLQIHGGVGFTWEYDCRLFLRRAQLLGLALGSASVWREKLIRRLLEKQPA
jgi:acyl-CoA dehydrogenase